MLCLDTHSAFPILQQRKLESLYFPSFFSFFHGRLAVRWMCPAQFGRTWKKGLGASVTLLRQLRYIGGNGGRLIKETKDKKWFAHPGLIAHDRGVDI